MTGFCSRCGAARLVPARFCRTCGARLDDDTRTPVLSAHDLRDITEEVPAVGAPVETARTDDTRPAGTPDDPNADQVSTSPSIPAITAAAAEGLRRAIDDAIRWLRPKAERWWARQRRHSARNSVAVCGLLLVLAITVAWTAGGTGGGSPNATKRTPSTRPAVARTSKRATSNLKGATLGPDPRVHDYVTQLEAILQASAAGRAQLASTVRSVQPACGSPSPQADRQLTTVVENRSILLHQLDLLGPGPDPATQAVSSLLHQALQASTQADLEYRSWNAATANDPSDQCSTDPSVAASLAAAHAYDSNATTFKTQFVSLFNPLAAQLGLPTWSQADF